MNKTRTLTETDFADPAKLLTSSNFAISETCSSAKSCWSEQYRKLNTMGGLSNEGAESVPGGSFYGNIPTVILKNGGIFSCMNKLKTIGNLVDDKVLMYCFVDLNGKSGPNVAGRDYFGYYITNKGYLLDDFQVKNNTKFDEKLWTTFCKGGQYRSACVTLIQNQGCKITS